jgi:hypothetical protein
MNAKKKLAETKAKLKKYAPQIAIIGTVAGAIAYTLYSTTKIAPVTVEIVSDDNEIKEPVSPIDGSDLPGGWEVIAAIAIDDLKRLSERDDYEVTNIDADLFRIKEVKTED